MSATSLGTYCLHKEHPGGAIPLHCQVFAVLLHLFQIQGISVTLTRLVSHSIFTRTSGLCRSSW
eukprot:scaffold1771_cov343-Pavlova_lutheri.AAC.12